MKEERTAELDWKAKGIQELLDSLPALGKEVPGFTEGIMGDILSMFSAGTEQFEDFTVRKLPYALKFRQITEEQYAEMKDALSKTPGNMAPDQKEKDDFFISGIVFEYLKNRAEAEGIFKDPDATDLVSVKKKLLKTISGRSFLKYPAELIFARPSETGEILSMFQLLKGSRKPITVTDPGTLKVDVIRKPYVDYPEVRTILRRMLDVGMLKINEGYVFLTKLGMEIQVLSGLNPNKGGADETEWEYIYAPLLVSKIFEAYFKNLQMRRVLSILSEKDGQTIFEIMLDYGPPGTIFNITWPVWAVPGILDKYGEKLDHRAKTALFSEAAWDVQRFLETFLHFGWVREKDEKREHSNGVKKYSCTLPCYYLTDAGRVVKDPGEIVPEAEVLIHRDLSYISTVYPGYRAGLVLRAVTEGEDTLGKIRKYLKKNGIDEEDVLILDAIGDLKRIGYDIRESEKRGVKRYSIPYEVNVISGNGSKYPSGSKPDFYVRKDEDRILYSMIDREHLILCDLAHRKELIKNARRNPEALFRVWFADMLKSAGVRCEPFGGEDGPDIVVDNAGFLVYVSIEGAFDGNPKLNADRMIRFITDKSLGFRAFLSPGSKDSKPYYVYIVREEDSFENREEVLDTIAGATGNGRGAVYGFREMLKIFNEYVTKVENGEMGKVMDRLFSRPE